MNGDKPQDTGGLSSQYQTYERQKCFIAYTERTDWSDDLLSACQEVLCRPEFNLESDYAGKHFDPDVPLRQKALELIANARYGIYDLSYWQDKEGKWQIPSNVFIELGMAIALNRPILLLRHANNRELELPDCLKSVSGHILRFSGETTLKRALLKRLPQWVNAPPERDWWNRYCIFGGRVCEYRGAHPRAKQWGQKTLRCHISDGPDVDRDDFRGVVEDVLGRFGNVMFDYLDALPVAKGYDFLLCTRCQTVRSTPFAIYRITPNTPAETFIAIGMSIALEAQFEYKISKILLTDNVQDVPSLLSGYEVVVARSDKDRKSHLRTFMPTVVQKVRETAWKPRPLPFIESVLPLVREVRAEAGKLSRFLPAGDLSLNLESRHLTKGELTYKLTPKEFELLKAFMRNPGRVLSRKYLMKKVWETDYVGDTRTLDVHIRRLREKIEDNPSNPLYLRTVRGVGYRFEAQVSDRVFGTVKWFDAPKGWGFITKADGEDIFVRYSGIVGEGYQDLAEGQRVEFTIEQTPKGPQAVQVVPLEDNLARDYQPISSPFLFGAPVRDPVMFFDREEELTRALMLIEREQHLSIVGPRRIGKTSLLLAIRQRLQDRKEYICLSIDMQGLRSEQEFYLRLEKELKRAPGAKLPSDDAKEVSVLEVETILGEVKRNEQRVVLLLDEFEVAAQGFLAGELSDQFFGTLRAWGSSNLITMVVVSATDLFELAVGSQMASPFANIFTVLRLGAFSREVASQLATLSGSVPFSQEEVDFIVDTTGGHPFFIQMFCSLLIEAKNRDLGQVDLQAVRKQFLEQIEPYRGVLDDALK